MNQYRYTITPDQIESGYGHLHHADSLRYLERGRLDLLREIGFPNDELVQKGLLLVIVSIDVAYKRELFSGEISVRNHSCRVDGRDIVVSQDILNHRGKVAVSAIVRSCFMSAVTRRAIDVPEPFFLAFSRAGDS